jgi:hypothetical protein
MEGHEPGLPRRARRGPIRRRGRARPVELCSEREVQALLGACSHRSATGVRNRALIALLYCSGLKISEALELGPADWERAEGRLAVRGRRARRVHLFPAADPYLEAWCAARSARGLGDDEPLFCTLAGGRVRDAYVRTLLPRLARKAGIAKRVHALGLRHSFAARLVEAGRSLKEIQEQLGHADVVTTFGYLAELTEEGEGRALRELGWSLNPAPPVVQVVVAAPARESRAEGAACAASAAAPERAARETGAGDPAAALPAARSAARDAPPSPPPPAQAAEEVIVRRVDWEELEPGPGEARADGCRAGGPSAGAGATRPGSSPSRS